ncbi:MAG: bacillithiol biosynthesis cysteine-adding enzyme BshC [Bryobacterales bacterium]|nr:bacillithiol biosynthesis cysteine-adding enzyme BshC [Bryobacterales bacterium]
MPGVCLRHTEIPHTSKLFADFAYRFDRLAPFYRHDPWRDEARLDAARAAAAAYPDSRRAALVAALREMNGPSASLDLLAQPGTVAVLTGQQVGLFGGPGYTIYKALTAVRHAEALTARGVPAVPVFWLATEDHDFAEVNHAWAFNGQQQPVRLDVTSPVAAAGTRPVGDIAIDAYPVAALRQALATLPFGAEIAAMVEQAYTPGATMGAAFFSLLRQMLPNCGLLYLCPQKPAIRELAAPLMRDAIAAAPLLAERLLARNQELAAAGYHAQVHFEAKTSLVFSLENGERIALRRDGDVYAAAGNGVRYTSAELAARAAQLSPNALLRPVIQDYLFPTAALIGGPAELAYLAQTEVIYRTLDRPMPVIAPRAGFSLLDARATKLLERYRLSVPDTFDALDALQEKIAAHLIPHALRDQLADARTSVAAALDGVLGKVSAFDPTLGESAGRSRGKILYQLQKIEAKTAREAFRRDERARGEASYLHSLLYYDKHLQERFYTILPFLARHGLGLIDGVYENVTLECPDHVILTV